MAISFGGLATGLDTNSIVDSLMNVERAPITSLQTDKTWLNNKLTAYQEFDTRLNAFQSSVATLVDREQYSETTITQTSSEYFTATADEDVLVDTNYRVEVFDLAQREKRYTDGFESQTEKNFGTGDLEIIVNDVHHVVEIDETNNSLEGIMNAINDAGIYVNANIINDGTDTNPYRLTLTADNVGQSIVVDLSGLTTGTDIQSLGTFHASQLAQQAHIQVDGIDIYSDSNEISDAIPGITLDLLKAEAGEITNIQVNQDTSAIETKINEFVTAYNDVISFVSEQSTLGETSAGVLGGDSGLSAIKRHLQNMLTSFVDTGGTYSTLAEIGLETQNDGTVVLNSATLSDAIKEDQDSIVNLLSGQNEDDDSGIASQFNDYLKQLTDSDDGLLAGRKKSIDDNIARIDSNIEKMETRLEKREATLRAQFNAMEILVSSMNTTADYLDTQLKSLEAMWDR